MKNRKRKIASVSICWRPWARKVCALMIQGAVMHRPTLTTSSTSRVRLKTELATCQASCSSFVRRYSTKTGMNSDARTPPSIRS